jgi:L-amino acid N-acyltransferase YncA
MRSRRLGLRVMIRPGVGSDIADIARIYRHYVLHTTTTFEEEPPSEDDWAQRMAQANSMDIPLLVADIGPQVVGYAYCSPWRARPAYRYTVENSVYLDPDAVGKGIGTMLLVALLEECKAAGIREVIAVIADTGNPASVALHSRCGFRHVGRLIGVGYKHGERLDTVLFQCSLATP